MNIRSMRKRDAALAIVAAFTLASLLACIRPRTVIPPNDEYAEQPTATADAPTPDDAPPTPPPEVASSDPQAAACERDSAQACVEFALPRVASAGASTEEKGRAVNALGRACALGRGDACYVYGLMIWMAEATPYDREEISYALTRSEELGYAKARVSYKDLVLARPDANTTPNPDILYHYKQACDLGIRRACSYFSVLTNNQPVELPIPEEPSIAGSPTTAPDTTPPGDTPPPPTEPPPTEPPPAVTSPKLPTGAPSSAETSGGVVERGLLVTGGLSFGQAYGVVETHRPQISYCYDKRVLTRGAFSGELILTLSVSTDGGVSKVDTMSSSIDDPETLSCISELARLWRFPASPEASRLSYRAELGAP